MEDPKLVEYFKKAFAKAREQGYSERVIRESAHEASPKAKWHERAYMSVVEGASVSFGISVVLMVVLFSSFIDKGQFLIPFLLFLPGALLYYFAISAFKHHANAKLFMTLLVSTLLSIAAVIINNLYATLLNNVSAEYQSLVEMADVARSFGADIPNIPALPLPTDIALPVLITAIFLAYNIAPIIGFLREHIKFKKSS